MIYSLKWFKEILSILLIMVGRTPGTTKDPNRRRVRNPNGRLIDFGGPQYNKLINNGYKLNRAGTRLIENPNFVAVERRGRPKKYPDVTTTHEKVRNPDTKRFIKTNTLNFRKLAQKYGYDKSKNKILLHVPDPNKPNKSIVKYDKKFNNYLKRGYIYNENDNSFIKPSTKTKEAFEGEIQSHELAIVNKEDPEIQMEQIKRRITILLERRLKKFKGAKFNIGFEVKFYKLIDGNVDEKITALLSAKSSRITHKSEIRKALKFQKEDFLRKIDRYTNQGSGWTISRIKKHFIIMYRYKPLRGKSYIPLPDSIQNRGATINIKNNDNKCFIYFLGRRLDPNPQKDHLERCNKRLKETCKKLGF